MSKRLILFRHGKSDWDAGYDGDHSRPLAPRGVKAAKRMGRLLADAGQVPPLVIASTAVRARSTIELAITEGGWPCTLQLADWLYDTHAQDMLAQVKKLPDKADAVLLVGHEPTWSQLTGLLIGGANIRFPTAAMVGIDFEIDAWNEVEPGLGELVWLFPPRMF